MTHTIRDNQNQKIKRKTCGFVLAVCAGMAASVAWANDVILRANDGSVEIHGTFQSFEDGVFTIDTIFQQGLKIPADVATCEGAACPELETAAAGPQAQEDRRVVLHALDEDYSLEGTFVGLEDGRYLIENELGVLQVFAQMFRCEGGACPDVEIYDPKFSISASDRVMAYLIPDLLQAYADQHALKMLTTSSGTLAQNVKLLNSDTGLVVADISLGRHEPRQADDPTAPTGADIDVFDNISSASRLRLDPIGDTYTLAYDADVMIVSDDNPIRDLSLAEARSVWTGAETTWRKFGGGDVPVELHLLQDAQSAVAAGASDLQKITYTSQPQDITFHETASDLIAAVKGTASAVGLTRRVDAVQANVEMLASRSQCGLIAQPSDFDIKISNYSHSRPVLAIAHEDDLHPVARDILDWSQSNDAQQSITDAGYASAKLQRMKIHDMGVALVHNAAAEPDFSGPQFARMMKELRRADRLSMAFRFATGSSQLDTLSMANIRELAVRLQTRQFEGQEILLVGFADSIGQAQINTAIAQRRADAVLTVLQNQLAQFGVSAQNIKALSFGEQLPLACNDTAEGRANNRRVEVWTRVIDQSDQS